MDSNYTKDIIRHILNSLPLRVYWKDLSGTYLGCNQLFCDDLGFSSISDVIGRSDSTVFVKGMIDLDKKKEWDILVTGIPSIGRIERISNPGALPGTRWIRVNKMPLKSEQTNSIEGLLVIYEDITAIMEFEERNKGLNKELHYRATHDYLTGLANRQEFESVIKDAIDKHIPSVLTCIDLDNFKTINDTSGHKAGDELLRAISQCMLGAVRRNDVVARLGGDEFGILLLDCHSISAFPVLDSIRTIIDNFRFTRNNYDFHVSISAGYIEIKKEETRTISELLANADIASYIAKSKGGNSIVSFDSIENEVKDIKNEFSMAVSIPSSIENNRFSLIKRPVTCVSRMCDRCSFVCAEMSEFFIRPIDKGCNESSILMKAAEKFNLSTRIDKWIIKYIIGWLQETASSDGVHINFVKISHQSALDSTFITFLKRELPAIPENCRLCLLVSEKILSKSSKNISNFFDQLKKLGVIPAIDDFSFDLDSFNFIRNGNVQILRMNEAILNNIETDVINKELLSATNKVARELNITTAISLTTENISDSILKSLEIDLIMNSFEHEIDIRNYQ